MHASGEIRTLNPSKRAAADLRLKRLCNPKAKFPVKPVFSLRQIYIRGAGLHKTVLMIDSATPTQEQLTQDKFIYNSSDHNATTKGRKHKS